MCSGFLVGHCSCIALKWGIWYLRPSKLSTVQPSGLSAKLWALGKQKRASYLNGLTPERRVGVDEVGEISNLREKASS